MAKLTWDRFSTKHGTGAYVGMQTHGLLHKRVIPTGLFSSGKVVPTSYALVLQMIASFANVDWSERPTSTQVRQTATKNGKSRYATSS